jgi:hypothetical protein
VKDGVLMFEPIDDKPLEKWQKWANEARVERARADKVEQECVELRELLKDKPDWAVSKAQLSFIVKERDLALATCVRQLKEIDAVQGRCDALRAALKAVMPWAAKVVADTNGAIGKRALDKAEAALRLCAGGGE